MYNDFCQWIDVQEVTLKYWTCINEILNSNQRDQILLSILLSGNLQGENVFGYQKYSQIDFYMFCTIGKNKISP